MTSGRVVRISGPVLDVRFESGFEPGIKALLKAGDVHMEVALQLRCARGHRRPCSRHWS